MTQLSIEPVGDTLRLCVEGETVMFLCSPGGVADMLSNTSLIIVSGDSCFSLRSTALEIETGVAGDEGVLASSTDSEVDSNASVDNGLDPLGRSTTICMGDSGIGDSRPEKQDN